MAGLRPPVHRIVGLSAEYLFCDRVLTCDLLEVTELIQGKGHCVYVRLEGLVKCGRVLQRKIAVFETAAKRQTSGA